MFTQAMFDRHVQKTGRVTRRAVTRAINAGVPWMTILAWLIQYGPELAKKLASLLELWKKEQAPADG